MIFGFKFFLSLFWVYSFNLMKKKIDGDKKDRRGRDILKNYFDIKI